MKLTSAQSAAVAHRGGHLLLSASAGSGKTEVLTRRCVSLVADDGCEIERLLVLTFTRAAAAELRIRIARALHRRAADPGVGPALRAHVRRQAALVDAAEICTIDSWCGRLIREHFAEAGIDPAFQTLDEEEAALLREEVLDELFEDLYRDRDPLATAVREWLARAANPDDRALRDSVLTVAAFLERLVCPQRWLDGQLRTLARDAPALTAAARDRLARALADECAEQCDGLDAMLGSAGAARAPLARYRQQLGRWRDRLKAEPAALEEVAGEIGGFSLLPRRARGAPPHPALALEVKERWFDARLRKRWTPETIARLIATAPDAARLVDTLLRLTASFRERLTAVKRQRACLEFADVERTALDLLGGPEPASDAAAQPDERRPTPIADELRERYDHILVDEYQDTSPVQMELLRLVARDGPRANRFMVGDVKQCIYAFRQAEPRLFVEQMAAFEAGREAGRVQYLADSFRSHARLLDGLNAMFAALLHPRLGGSTYGPRERLRARRPDVPNPALDAHSRIELHVLEAGRSATRPDAADDEPEPPQDAVELERVEREAWLAADAIRRMLETPLPIPQIEPSGAIALRPLRRSDVAILLRAARGNAALVAGVLRQAGIACVTGGSEALLASVEVRDVCNVLALLASRRQDVPMAGYLRGPLVGLSADELLAIRRAAPRGPFALAVERFAEAGTDERLRERVRAALAQLDDWLEAARNLELPALLRTIDRDGALTPFVRGLRHGRDRLAMLRSLQAYAARFVETGRWGTDDFIAYLEDLSRREIEPGAAAAPPEDAVRVMTIHAAKGLEFPVVFLLNAGAAFRAGRAGGASAGLVRCDEQLGAGVNFVDYVGRRRLTSAEHFLIGGTRARRELEEEMRLLYVAATRARERLVVVGHADPETWSAIREQAEALRGPPPLISLSSAASMLEWCMWGAAASGASTSAEAPPLIEVRATAAGRTQPAPLAPAPQDPAADAAWDESDETWLRQAAVRVLGRIDPSGSRLPAVVSASALKSRAFQAARAEPVDAESPDADALRLPAFAATGHADGAELGVAVHRFLQYADASRLETEPAVRGQIDALCAARRLTADEAARIPVADVVWFAHTTEGARLARAADARRELPFVFSLAAAPAGERVIVRGVIDCLIEGADGLTILDYKTDRPADEEDFRARLAGYARQMQVYAWAASEISGRPVIAARLVFLRARRVVDVALERPDPTELLSAD